MASRRKAAEATAPAAPEAPTNGTPQGEVAPKEKPVYNVFVLNSDGAFLPKGQERGRNAKEALSAYFRGSKDNPGDDTWVLVPERMVTRVKAEVETKTRVALKAV